LYGVGVRRGGGWGGAGYCRASLGRGMGVCVVGHNGGVARSAIFGCFWGGERAGSEGNIGCAGRVLAHGGGKAARRGISRGVVAGAEESRVELVARR